MDVEVVVGVVVCPLSGEVLQADKLSNKRTRDSKENIMCFDVNG